MTDPASRIDQRLERARARFDRVAPERLADEVAAGALVVDLRPASDRAADGGLPGAVVIERIHLEWRLDPTSGASIPEAQDDLRVVLVCNEGYSSSLAAADLLDLGISRATDLEGGYRAWKAAVGEPDRPIGGTAPPGPATWVSGLLTFGGIRTI